MSITEYGYDDTERCPCCSKELIEGCCMECGECYDPNP